jgi:hypothetical protein
MLYFFWWAEKRAMDRYATSYWQQCPGQQVKSLPKPDWRNYHDRSLSFSDAQYLNSVVSHDFYQRVALSVLHPPRYSSNGVT